jgi:hexosaminidase
VAIGYSVDVRHGSRIVRRLQAAGKPAALSLGVALSLAALGAPPVKALPAHASPTDPGDASIIPLPNHVIVSGGSFRFDDQTPVYVPAHDAEARSAAVYLQDVLVRSQHPAPTIVDGVQRGEGVPAITFRRRAGLGPEAYRLDVTPRGITVSATGSAGLFYGAVTLWQLLTPRNGPISVAGQTIHDAPVYPWRGLMLDSARHVQSASFIRSMIDAMAVHKLNVLHWHLTDDQGWRLEIRKFPRLTSVGAWRTPAHLRPSAANDAAGPSYGGFYTQDEVRSIVAYAASRHVTIVPEIEMPGHAQAAIAAYPELGVTDAGQPHARLEVSARWGVHTHLFNIEPATFTFLEDVLAEVLELFPGKDIHVGGDEAVKQEWNDSAAVRARAKTLGITDADALQAYFTQEIGRYLAAHGRRLVGWDEILRPGLERHSIVMSWHGTRGAHDAAVQGFDAVLAPQPTFYFDNRQSGLATEGPGRLTIVSLEDVYRFDMRDPTSSASAKRHILGLQANLWTEHMQTEERVQRMAWPRAAAIAELGWSDPARHDWPDFLRRLVPMFARYSELGLAYADSVYAVDAQRSRSDAGIAVALSNQARAGEIRYTLDGSDPTVNSALYTAPLAVPSGTEIHAATFVQSRQASDPWVSRLDAGSLGRRDSHDLELCSNGVGLLLEPTQGRTSRGAPLAIDIMNPCWIDRGVDLTRGGKITASVAALPFNYELGKEAGSIRVGDAHTADGELEIHIDGCDTPAVVTLPLATAAGGITELPSAALPARAGRHDLCIRFARPRLDPMWALDWIEVGE